MNHSPGTKVTRSPVGLELSFNYLFFSRSYMSHERRIPSQLSTGHLMGTKITKLYK